MANFGQNGEQQATNYLIKQGHTIVARNFQYYGNGRGRRGEIDIITRYKNELHFVEVKTRSNTAYGHPLAQITPQKVQLLRSTVEYYLIKMRVPKTTQIRLDVITLLDGGIEYFPNAY
jgi:putative endonuclease